MNTEFRLDLTYTLTGAPAGTYILKTTVRDSTLTLHTIHVTNRLRSRQCTSPAVVLGFRQRERMVQYAPSVGSLC
jgi:hypothetical protein